MCLPKDPQVWIFGSRAKGKARRGSDLDLAIDLGRPIMQPEKILLSEVFAQSNLPYTVDIADIRTVSDKFQAILEFGRVEFKVNVTNYAK